MAKNLPASVRNRLLEVSKTRGEDTNLIWARYAIERLLYRLSISEHAGHFTLKGAMLFLAWTGKAHRPTRDLDFLGTGDSSEENILKIFRSFCEMECPPDGVRFDAASIQLQQIREDQEYEGHRIVLKAHIDTVTLDLQIDIGFGDAVTPKAEHMDYPVLLDFPAPRVRGYPPETVVAEKSQAMVALGLGNSRMKDFYDIREIARHFAFDGAILSAAIHATFERRNTQLPTEAPLALTDTFAKDAKKITQWKAFLKRMNLKDEGEQSLEAVIASVREFVGPPMLAGPGTFGMQWTAGGSWISSQT